MPRLQINQIYRSISLWLVNTVNYWNNSQFIRLWPDKWSPHSLLPKTCSCPLIDLRFWSYLYIRTQVSSVYPLFPPLSNIFMGMVIQISSWNRAVNSLFYNIFSHLISLLICFIWQYPVVSFLCLSGLPAALNTVGSSFLLSVSVPHTLEYPPTSLDPPFQLFCWLLFLFWPDQHWPVSGLYL